MNDPVVADRSVTGIFSEIEGTSGILMLAQLNAMYACFQ